MGPISKEQLRLHFDFGRHFCADDAESLRRCIKRVNPDILILESAFVSQNERKSGIIDMNRKVERARWSRGMRKRLLREMFDHCGLFEWPDFGRAVMGMTLSQPALRLHIVEESPAEDAWGDMFMLPFMMGGPNQAVGKLFEGDVAEALSIAVKSFRDFNDFLVVRRNRQVVDGFIRLPEEIGELHPSIPHDRPVTILTRYGMAHAGIVESLKGAGFSVGTVCLPLMDFSTDLTVRYSMNPSMGFSDEDARRILFEYALGVACDDAASTHEEDVRRCSAISASVGGAAGFISSAQRLAQSSPTFADFQARLRKFFEDAQKGIYSASAQ